MTRKIFPLARPQAPAFFGGLILSFVLLVLAGAWSSRQAYLGDFQRFHRRISPESYFYPTSSLIEQTVLTHSRPDQTLVFIGGSSVFNGVSQPVGELWTHALQNDLGEGYRVFNFALRGGYPTDAGAVAAEMFRQQGRKVIYVADLAPGSLGEPDGRDVYRYIFWDAYYRHKLSPFAARENYLQERIFPEAEEEANQEMKRALGANRFFHSVDLWNYLAYSAFSTIWAPNAKPFFLPKRFFKDKEKQPPPLGERFQEHFEAEMKTVRGPANQFISGRDKNGWKVTPAFEEIFLRQAEPAFAPAHRSSTILVTTGPAPYYLKQLSAEEREKMDAVYDHQQKVQEKAGFLSINAIGQLADEDFSDRCHLTVSGGRKIAASVAKKIRAMPPAASEN